MGPPLRATPGPTKAPRCHASLEKIDDWFRADGCDTHDAGRDGKNNVHGPRHERERSAEGPRQEAHQAVRHLRAGQIEQVVTVDNAEYRRSHGGGCLKSLISRHCDGFGDILARCAGLEPATPTLEGWCSAN